MTERQVPWGLVVWLGLAAVWMTWAPFEFRSAWPPLQLLFQVEPETLGHFFLLMPFGMLAVAYSSRDDGRSRAQALLAVALIGLFLEAGQGFVVGRSVSPHDLLVGYLGAVLAIGATVRLMRGGVTAESVAGAVAAVALLLVWGLMVHGAVSQNRGLGLTGWSAEFPIAAAEEVGGQRQYLGTVDEARICAGEANEVCAGQGADAPTRARLARTALDSGSVRVTARVVADGDDQEGPARIVTFSDGAYLRNVTLAQRRRNLILRLRTERGGPNGTALEFVLVDAVHAGQPTRLTATYARGVVTLRAESATRTVEGVYRPPFRNSLRTQGIARPRPPLPLAGRAPLVGTVVQFLGLGLALGYGLRSRLLRMTVAAVMSIAFLWVVDVAFGHAPGQFPADYALASVAALLGAVTRRGHVTDRGGGTFRFRDSAERGVGRMGHVPGIPTPREPGQERASP